MQNQIENLINAIVDDYRVWTLGTEYGKKDYDRAMDRVKQFADAITVKEGSKYTKIFKDNGGSVWGFVVAVDTDKKFRKGDILMPAGFNAPARNSARGNILHNDFDINWTGPKYL